MEYDDLTDDEILKELAKASTENQLLIWWEQCYGSPYNPEFTDEGKPYPDWQRRFYDAGDYASQRMLMAANGVGKSITTCAELAAHATGQYPEWWRGRRFERGGWEAWIGSIDNNMQKIGPQRALMGRDLDSMLGTGLLPRASIVDFDRRQAGVKDVVDTVIVRHNSGENVVLTWKTFEQGWRKWQSGDPKIILWDEEPDDSVVDQKDILSETLTRLVRNSGIWIVGYTPLLGQTNLTEHFMEHEDPSLYVGGATWDEAPHMSLEDRKRIEAQYKTDAERDARARGIPMLGEGAIFSAKETSFLIDPIQIPSHWARIKGIDFGGIQNHPHAIISLAIDRDTDTKYVYAEWRDNGKTRDHAHAINATDSWMPVAWPHDGMVHDKGSGSRLYRSYRDTYHVSMLSKSARYKNDEGGAQPQWPIIETVRDDFDSGKLKVFRTCQKLVREYRSYHMKDGKIVAKRDDLLKALFYAYMMRRYAKSGSQGARLRSNMPAPFTTAVT
ncbi:MAG: terminase family protein [Gammaproteobacteria bacterium]